MTAIWNNLRQVWANTDWSWIVLWLGLTMLIVALVVLMRTRWGQSQPLGKCAVLSLVAHLLLAIYATTVQIVTASAGRPHADPIRAAFVDADEWMESLAVAPRPVNQTASDSGETPLWPNDLEPVRLAAKTPDLQRAEDGSHDGAAQQEPFAVADLKAALPSPAATPQLETTTNTPLQPAETIDASTPQAAAPAAEVVPEVVSPDRLSFTETSPASAATDNHGIDRTAPPESDVGLSDPLSHLPSDTQFKAGDSSLFQRRPSPAEVAAEPLAVDNAGEDASSNVSGENSKSLLVPVKAMNRDGAHAVPPIYSDRTAADRDAVARSRGGSAEAEAAVQAALAWLAANQNIDGRWDADRFGAGEERKVLGHDRQGAGARADTATTGLALLAFLGAGHTHVQGKYKDHVKRGLEHLLSVGAQDGSLGGDAELFAFMYSHGIATLALSEAYALTGDKRLEGPVRAAIAYSVAAQHPSTGGWRYRPAAAAPHDPGDTSQLGWQLMALKSADLAGIAMPERTRQGMLRFLNSVSSGAQGGLAGYRPKERVTPAMTAEALASRQFLGLMRDHPAAKEAGDFLLDELPSKDQINLYYWYYGTLGMYQLQGDHWRRWNAALQSTLVDRQVTNGNLAGSWDPDCIWAGYGGRVYSTAMAALCLEIYYRYLPLYGDLGPETREAKRPQSR
ncbi:MAG: prenyltransferase/squalene oxidase repeat-containing protein [Pirellulales bacterium]